MTANAEPSRVNTAARSHRPLRHPGCGHEHIPARAPAMSGPSSTALRLTQAPTVNQSLRLFSPAAYSSLSGRLMPTRSGEFYRAQIAADLVYKAELTWATTRPLCFLPDDIDGRALFGVATARRRALDAGRADTGGIASLGDIVAVRLCARLGTPGC